MRGLLILKLIEARNLEAKDINGFSDPYFTLSLGGQRASTQIYLKTLQPTIEETFNFFVDDAHHVIKIEAFDKDIVGKDDNLGHCEVDLTGLAASERTYTWHQLKNCKHGEIRLFTWFINLESSDPAARDEYGFVITTPPPSPTPLPDSPSIISDVDYRTIAGDKLPRDGVPATIRGEIWLVRSGAKAKRNGKPDEYKTLNSMFEKAAPEVVEQIDKDLHRTFPGHPYFVADGPGVTVLRRVLISFAIHCPRVGYCQGMNFVAGFLLLFLDEEDAFWVLDSIVNDILVNYYDGYLGGLQVDSKLVDYYIMQYFPDLQLHLDTIHASASINCMKWFLSIFVGIFPTEVTLRIWDSLFISGRDVLLRVYLNVVRRKFAQGLKVEQSTDFYELLNNTPPLVHSPSVLFAELNKHFSHLYQVNKMRSNAQKAISDSINKREELRLRHQTHFSMKELEDLKQAFSSYAVDHTLDKETFHKLLSTQSEGHSTNDNLSLFADEIFRLFDKSGDGRVDFREFCTGLSAFTKGSLDERLQFCYSLFDMNNDGYVQPDELLLILGAQYKILFPDEDLSFVKNFVDFATMAFDTNKDGKFSLEEFKEVVRKQPLIVQFLNLNKETANEFYSFGDEDKSVA